MIYNIFEKKTKKPKIEKKEKIIIDFREKNSLLPSFLKKYFEIEFKELKVGDYLIKDTIIERKSPEDFAQSIINKRLFKQLEEIKQYPNYLLLIEGNPYKNNLTENVVKGTILSITLNHKVPILITKNQEETSKYFYLISKKQKKETALNPKKKNLTKSQQIQFVLEAFPGIGPKTSKKLLKKFKSIKKIINSSEKNLKSILGNKTTQFKEIITTNYKD
jgi:Fanconi anemia group M protein